MKFKPKGFDDDSWVDDEEENPLYGVTGYFILARRNRFGAAN
jgi:hypothetical protein